MDDRMEEELLTVYLEDGTQMDCQILTIFEAQGRDYIALLPLSGELAESGEAIIYRYSEDENEEPVLDNITDDAEFEVVEEAFDEWLDSCEYDELVSDEDL